jgi:hypothetical protein
MADNIKIVGEIITTEQLSRYDEADLNLLSPFILNEDFGQPNDYIEYYLYDIEDNLLNFNYSYKDFKSPPDSYLNPDGTLPIIEIDPIKDIQNLNYTSGEFKTQYNFFSNRVSDPSAGLFLKEISSDRTEIKVGSTTFTNEQIENSALSLINEYSGSAYFVNYLINFGNNTQAVAVNVALNKLDSGYEMWFKLYQPLSVDIEEKITLWIVEEKVNPYIFNVNLDKLILPPTGSQLRGPNFDIEIPNKNNIGTSYQNYNNLINSLQNVSSSYQQLLSLITSQSIDINTEYTDFSNFVFFSSAKQRLFNFYGKVKDIEDYKNNINIYVPLTSSYPNLISDYNNATASINNTIANFDGFEYYLYFESGSTLTSSLEYGINPYPKTGTQKPFTLLSTGSITTKTWFNASTASAGNYDDYNQNNLIYTIPSFIIDDDNNAPYLTFLNMVGHYFDNIWIYLDAITDINLANNNLEKGISKDLVYTVLQSLGTKLYNKYGDVENDLYLVGQNSGSNIFDNNFTPTGSYLNNIPRKDLLAETYKRIYHNLPLLLKTRGTTYGLQILVSTFGITSSILDIKEYGGYLKSQTLNEFNSSKVRILSSSIVTGSVLSPYISLQQYPSSSNYFRSNDSHYVDVSFSPQTQIDAYASSSISSANPTWSIDDFIGDPGYLYSGSYTSLDQQRNTYFNFTASNMDYAGFIRLIQFFDNSLFKMVKDFVPARANLSTGITINSPVLERNKFSYANPSSTSKINIYTGSIDGPTISSEYTDLYTYLTGSKLAYYDGAITGSVIEYGDEWIAKNFNPYLLPTSSLTATDINVFNHSEFNVLLNNVSQSILSLNRKLLQPIYIGSGLYPTIAGYSSSYFAELQDSYETLTTYNNARYNGTKISSLLYNTYTSASSTYVGDNSYGKTATTDKQVRQIGLFTEIVSSSFLPKRNRVSLKYLVDEFGGLTELNQRNKHWEDVQRTFIAGNIFNISQFDNQKFGNQKTTDGDKLIFDSGYSYYPILYFSTCSSDPKIFFENLGGSNAFLVTANNGPDPRTISGSGTMTFPISSSNVYKIFNSEIDPDNIFTTGAISTPPTYSVQESGDHRVEASFNLTVSVTGANNLVTGSLIMLKNGTPLLAYSETWDLNQGGTTGSLIIGYYTPPGSNPTLTYASIITTGRSIFIGGLSRPAGTTLYKYTQPLFGTIGSTPSCTLSDPQPYPYYSLGPGSFPITTPPSCSITRQYNVTSDLYYIDNPELPSLGEATKLLFINRPDNFPVNGLVEGDQISFILNISSSNNNFTASISQGSLAIGSLAASTGYASAVCPYFHSASISASLVSGSGSTNIITFPVALSNFHNNGYQFVPNPDTGSLNSLYSIYGDVDYPFITKQSDIVLTYLSDGTYVESRIISSSYSGSFFRIHLDNIMSNQYVNNLMSGSYQRFLLLSRLNDETNAHSTFRKRSGKTSYGFVIPDNLAPDVLNNIDTITRQVKQKLLADQQGSTI